MITNSRKKDIVDILYKRERISVSELSKTLYVSEMTIRRDLTEMEKEGILKRYRGGAVLITSSDDMPISKRVFFEEDEKKILSKKASKYLFENSSVYIDSSSTCQYIIPHISKFKNIMLVTNSINTVLTASNYQIQCFLIGGKYFSRDMCFVGTVAEQYAQHFNVDVAFFSARGFSANGIISDNDIEQCTIRKQIMQRSKKNIFLFESGKLNQKYFYTLCKKSDVDDVITAD